jgi:hypothetical protein
VKLAVVLDTAAVRSQAPGRLSLAERDVVSELIGREHGPVAALPLHLQSVPTVAAHAPRVGFGVAQAVDGLLDPYDVLELS